MISKHDSIYLLAYPGCGAGLYGRLVERSKTLSLDLSVGVSSTYRGFESHTFRQTLEGI